MENNASNSITESKTKGILAILVSALGFAFMGMFVRLADDYGSPISPFQKSFFRNIVAFLVALVFFAKAKEKNISLIRSSFPILILRSICGTLGVFGNFIALSYIPIADAMALNKTSPFFVVLFSWLFMKEKISLKQSLAIVISFMGALFIIKPGIAGDALLPAICGFIGGIGAGGAYTALRSLGKRGVDGKFIVLFFSAISCIATLPFLIFDFNPMTGAQLVILISAGLFASIGQFAITAAYRYAKARDIASFDYTGIVFSAILGFFAFNQKLDAFSIIGFILIASMGIILSFFSNAKTK